MAETDKTVSPITGELPASGGLVGALKRVQYQLGLTLQATQQMADGMSSALESVSKKAEQTAESVSRLTTSAGRTGSAGSTESTTNNQLGAITESLMQQVGRR